MANEVPIDTIEGPKGSADIIEVTVARAGGVIDVEYVVVFGGERQAFASMGEAHVAANQLTGAGES
jgi:hypothetical protein